MIPWYLSLIIVVLQMVLVGSFENHGKNLEEILSFYNAKYNYPFDKDKFVKEAIKKNRLLWFFSLFPIFFITTSILDGGIFTYIMTGCSIIFTFLFAFNPLSIKRVFNEIIRREKIKDQKEREKLEKEQMEKDAIFIHQMTLEEKATSQFNLVINCPLCRGFGECMVQVVSYELDDGSCREKKSIWKEPNNWNARYQVEKSDFTHYLQREKCPGCNGKGTAYAYFEIKELKCNVCNGVGVKVKSETIKKVIGIETVENRSNCDTCNGAGKKTEKVVNIATHYRLPENFSAKFNDANMDIEINGRFISLIVNQMNNAFFEKNELRKFHYLKTK